MKKGQVQSQMFIYILSIIIIGLLLLFGVKWIGELINQGKLVNLLKFKKTLENEFERAGSYESINYIDLETPGWIKKICFLQKGAYHPDAPICKWGLDYDALACNSWKDNMGFVQIKPTQDVDIELIEFEVNAPYNYYCVNLKKSNQLKLKLVGLGDKVSIVTN
jgi:hypothetical protein